MQEIKEAIKKVFTKDTIDMIDCMVHNPFGDKNYDPDMDQSVIEAYERYVMAQFKWPNADGIEVERGDAIKSLIPGTKYYYHLYFLNLIKK